MKNEQKKHREYIAFEGEKFTIEWYFDNKGMSISLDYLESLDEKEQTKLFELIKLIGNRGMKATKFMLLSLNPIGSYVFSLRDRKLL